MGHPSPKDHIPPTHALRTNAWGTVHAGSKHIIREIGRRTSLTRDQASEAWHAALDIMAIVLLNGYEVRLGELGRIRFVETRPRVRRPSLPTMTCAVSVPNRLRWGGHVGRQALADWHELHGIRWPEEDLDDEQIDQVDDEQLDDDEDLAEDFYNYEPR